MKWKIGQKVVCDQPRQNLADCHVRAIDMHESVIIFCPDTNTVICGQRQNLERLGWRLQSSVSRLN
ncbi:MAG: hypothetical protein KME45_08815 [Stenomitos rutilans HA7619-LM2]|nr:hypothetical protein [Stenomitos rutilans HA7619-LM2]